MKEVQEMGSGNGYGSGGELDSTPNGAGVKYGKPKKERQRQQQQTHGGQQTQQAAVVITTGT